jgi:choline kinase
MKTAIILAAGVGSRLRPLTDSTPKCCIKVGGVSLIRRVIGQIIAVDKNTIIYVVAGYLADILRAEMVGLSENVIMIENTDYLTTNNMESCRLALSARSQKGSSLILNGDCIYSSEIVSKMMHEEHSCIAADSSIFVEENMKIEVDGSTVINISKNIQPGTNVYTSIDIYNFTHMDLQKLLQIMEKYYYQKDLQQWTEVAICDLLSETKVRVLDISPSTWMEIDNHEDLENARLMFT